MNPYRRALCHGLRVTAFRDPWPAPVTPLRKCRRIVALMFRKLEAIRPIMLDFRAPRFWSPVIWALAEKSVLS